MAKILISSHGTGIKKEGGYKTAKYKLHDEVIETTFISKALSEMLKIDKLYLVGTKGSIWDSCYSEFGGNNQDIEFALYEKIEQKELKEVDLEIVNQTIDNALGTKGSKCFIIEYGLNDGELWENFNQYIDILEHIQDGDTVYIDISHAFRSLALMSFLMVQFGHIIKNKKFKIGGIYYGMLEVSRENDGITPIVDLKIFYDLMEWIKAVDAFKNYANGEEIADILKDIPAYKEEYNIFRNLTDAMRIANMAAVKLNINTIATKLKVIESSENPVISLMSGELKEFIERLNKEKMSDFQLALAEWYCEHKHYALSYMALTEAIVSKSCEYHGFDIDTEDGRNGAKQKIYQMHKELFEKVYNNVKNIRNAVCHQLKKREQTTHSDIVNLPSYIEKTKRYFAQIDQ